MAAGTEAARELDLQVAQGQLAEQESDQQMIQHVGALADRALVALLLERARQLVSLFAQLGADFDRTLVEQRARVALVGALLAARLELAPQPHQRGRPL